MKHPVISSGQMLSLGILMDALLVFIFIMYYNFF